MFVSEMGFGGLPPQVVVLPLTHSRDPKVALSGFAAPIVALGAHEGRLYVGSVDGNVYRIRLQ